MRVPQWIKPGVWGAVIGAVAMMIIGLPGGAGPSAARLSIWQQSVRMPP